MSFDAPVSPFRDHTFLTLGGTETYLHFLQGFSLPDMCGFRVLEDEAHYARMEQRYLYPIADAAAQHGHALLVDALVWRASSDHVRAAGYDERDVARLNALGVRKARASMDAWRRARGLDEAALPLLVGGDLGPRGDGYQRADGLTPESAYAYHREQIEALAEAGVDVLTALTLTSAAEAIGVTRAARELGLPVVISATVETDGRLPDGSTLEALVARVDDATGGAPELYMVNCAHPSHVLPVLEEAEARGAAWLARVRGFRGNASTKSHAELDASPTLDRGDPRDFADRVAHLKDRYGLCIVGGCCGTDAEHVIALAERTAARG